MRFTNKYYRWLAEVTLILVVLFLARLWMQGDTVTGIAPNFNSTMLNGQPFDLYNNKERPMLVHFWATWCPVCKLEQSNIDNLAKNKPVITIAMQSGSNAEIKQFMQDENLSFKVINDNSGLLSKAYHVQGVPVSFIVNKENKVEFLEVGYTTELGLRLRLWWAGL